MRFFLFVFLMAAGMAPFAHGQAVGVCGNGAEPELIARLLENKAALAAQGPSFIQNREIKYVPIRFILVAKADGSGRAAITKIFDQVCGLNEDFADQNIQFFLKDAGYVLLDNDQVYEKNYLTTILMRRNKDANAINVYVVGDASPREKNPDEEGVTLGYFNPVEDWLVIRKEELNGISTTLSHELGHFFSLAHTHSGWDATPWDASVYEGKPVPKTSPGGIPTEKMDRSNCDGSGDFLCDTPPDYNFGFAWGTCNFTANALDPDGVRVDPQETNIMGYFLRCEANTYQFTQEQKALMATDLASNRRRAIRQVDPGNVGDIGQPVLLSPAKDEVTPFYNEVTFSWQPVPNATFYLLEIDRVPSFSISPFQYIVTDTTYTTNELVGNRRYYWRIRPMNGANVCNSLNTGSIVFRTGGTTSTEWMDQVQSWSVFPNPSQGYDQINIRLQLLSDLEVGVQVADLTGRQLKWIPMRRYPAGNHIVEVSVADLPSGVYLISLVDPARQIETRRLVVTR